MTGIYSPPWWLQNGHVNTIVGGRLRRVRSRDPERQRIDTPDGDFLDLDWYRQGADRLVVLQHGLEGSSRRCYIRGMAKACLQDGWDVLAWNYRGCSGEPNRLLRSYHSGETGDLRTVLETAGGYAIRALIGFSLGGNVTLKYLGEEGPAAAVDAAVAISVPCDLAASSRQLARPANRIYMDRFMRGLRAKTREKMARFPGALPDRGLDTMRTFAEFDEHYTAPIHGFAGAEDYWTSCSSRAFIGRIRRPALILNALDDPFLAAGCYPEKEAADNPLVQLETPDYGGHVGFVMRGRYWSERRALDFLAGATASAR